MLAVHLSALSYLLGSFHERRKRLSMCQNISINLYLKESVKQDLMFSSLESALSLTGLTFLLFARKLFFCSCCGAMVDQVGPLFFPAFELLLMNDLCANGTRSRVSYSWLVFLTCPKLLSFLINRNSRITLTLKTFHYLTWD